MNLRLIVYPLVGALIGYITNWIAVKMLFRPSKAIYIGKFKLPFTPGIIPKNQERLALGTSKAITKSLLNEEILKETLLSEEIISQIEKIVKNYLESTEEKNVSLQEFLINNISSEKYNELYDNVRDKITDNIYKAIVSANIGTVASEKIEEIIDTQVSGFTKIVSKSLVNKNSDKIKVAINDYIENNSKEMISDMVSKEIDKYLSTTNMDLKDLINNSNIGISDIVITIYKNIISSKLTAILETIDLDSIIKNRINNMDALEMEKLILSIIDKELKALVNLGAIIGFILGLINLFV